jgi:hypothetical protein
MKKLIFTFAVIFAITLAAQVPDKPLLKVFDAAYRSNPRQNIMLSPYGIQQRFGMLTGWAPKLHSSQLNEVLGLYSRDRHDLRNARLALQ